MKDTYNMPKAPWWFVVPLIWLSTIAVYWIIREIRSISAEEALERMSVEYTKSLDKTYWKGVNDGIDTLNQHLLINLEGKKRVFKFVTPSRKDTIIFNLEPVTPLFYLASDSSVVQKNLGCK